MDIYTGTVTKENFVDLLEIWKNSNTTKSLIEFLNIDKAYYEELILDK